MCATVLIAASLMGQTFEWGSPYYPFGLSGYSAFGFGNGYGTFPYPMILPGTNPIQNRQLYEGLGSYSFPVTPVFPFPKVIEVVRTSPGSPSLHEPRVEPGAAANDYQGETGQVVNIDHEGRSIRLKLPTETVDVAYGPQTTWASSDGSFPEVKVGSIISVANNKITVVKH